MWAARIGIDMDYETLASAFALLNGNPPKSLRYRNGRFEAEDARAIRYRAQVEGYIRELHPCETDTQFKLRYRRNCVLRALYKQMGVPSK